MSPAPPAQQEDAAPWICLGQAGHQRNTTISLSWAETGTPGTFGVILGT